MLYDGGRVPHTCDEHEELEEEHLDKFTGVCWECIKRINADKVRCPMGGDKFAKSCIVFCIAIAYRRQATVGNVVYNIADAVCFQVKWQADS